MRKATICLSPLFGVWRFHTIVLLLLILGSLQVSPVTADGISVDGDCTLAQAIESANEGRAVGGCAAGEGADTMELTSDIALSAELPAITSAITIMGGGFAINGDQRFRLFFVAEDGELSFEGLTLRDGNATEDARVCIDWDPGEWTAGGAICNLGALIVSESRFSGNVAEFGGAIASVGTITVNGSEFGDNTALSGGAIFNWGEGTLTVNGSDFSGNTATIDRDLSQEYLDTYEDDDREFGAAPIVYNGNGGAIANSLGGDVIIVDSSFVGNEGGLAAGAIVSHGDLAIIDSEFSENSAYGGGGAIESFMGAFSIEGSVFSGNSSGTGGAVESWGTWTVDDSQFHDNRAGRGGAIIPAGQSILTITRSEFSGNKAGSGGAIFGCVFCELTVTESSFSGNSARLLGGAIFNYGNTRISASQFHQNSAGDLGGAIHNPSTLNITDSELVQNSARSGGGIYNDSEYDGVLQQDGNSYSGNRGGDCVGCD